MVLLKKLFFAPIFIILFGLLLYFVQPILKSQDLLFSFNQQLLIDFIIFAGLTTLTSLSFIIFSSLAQDLKLSLPVILLASLLMINFFPQPASFMMAGGIFLSLILVYFILDSKLKTYITFSPSALLSPSIKMLTTLIILVLSFGYYLLVNVEIQKNGFKVPDSLIDMALKMATGGLTNPGVKGVKIAQLPQITPEQIDFLKQNPELLKQYGIDPSMLDQVQEVQNSTPPPANTSTTTTPTTTSATSTTPTSSSKSATTTPVKRNNSKPAQALSNISLPIAPQPDFTKNLVKSMLNKTLEPYLPFVAPLMAVIFFTTIKFFTSIIELILSPLLLIIYSLLENTGIIRYEKETREVKKFVV